MKKSTSAAILIILLISMAVGTGTAFGQGFGLSWDSGLTVANLTDVDAQIVITFYPQSGSEVVYQPADPVPGNGSLKFFPLDMLDDGFNGSAVISSDQPIAATVNQLTTGGGGSYEGLSAGSLEATLPIIMRANGGYNTTFNIQNAGDDTAEVYISFTPATYGSADTDGPFSIEPGRALTFDQSEDTELGSRFVGSALITSDVPIVAAVNQVNPDAKVILSYRGFTSGSPTVALPTIQSANSDYYTGIAVKNVGEDCTTVTVTFGPNTVAGSTFDPVPEEQADVCEGESVNFNQWGGQWTSRYVGSATVSNSADMPLVVNVNQLRMAGVRQGSAYSGFDPSGATLEIVVPTLMAFNGGYSSGFLVQNVSGTGATATFTVTYSTSAGTYTNPVDEIATDIADGAGYNFRQFVGQWTAADQNNSQRWVGSAVVQCSQPCVAVVNQLKLSGATADTLLTYTGVNK